MEVTAKRKDTLMAILNFCNSYVLCMEPAFVLLLQLVRIVHGTCLRALSLCFAYSGIA
jgi:hypothetical protein